MSMLLRPKLSYTFVLQRSYCACTTFNENSGSKYVYVNKDMNWTDAQKYCRANHTDLASVRNQSENDAIEQLLMDNFAWIGLYSESWRWSDGQRLKMTSFSKWNPSQRVDVENSCVTTGSGVWNIRPCSNKYPFICSDCYLKVGATNA
uniref:C-type lectin domain-containing protein n=1 Tax=Cyprinodon variegatus TaxID=28743 RepID=A0A3Q2DTJ0_CYPVA